MKNNVKFQQNESIKEDNNNNFAIKGDLFIDLGTNNDRIETFPPTSLLSEYSFITRFWRALKRHHKWIRIFTYPSIRYTRLMRLFVAANDLLFIVFFNSLFYSIFYPDNNHCQDLSDTSEENCLHEPSHFEYSKSLCEWDIKTEICSLRNPSHNIVFIVEVSMLIIVFSIIPRKLTQFILEKFCSKRPILESVGLSSSLFLRNEPESLEKSSYVLINNNITYNESIENKLNIVNGNSSLDVEKKLNLEIILDSYKKCNTPTSSEEVLLIQSSIQKYLIDESSQMESYQKFSSKSDLVYAILRLFKLRKINELSEINQSILNKVSRKITNIRNRSKWIKSQAVDLFEVGPSQLDYIDLVLLQQYILEQIPPLPRFVIRQEIYEMDHCTPGRLNLLSWIFSWLFVLGVWGYLSYYSIHWAMTNGVGPSSAWGLVLLVVILADVFVNDIFQILFYFVIITDKIRPQLRNIYIVLRDVWEKKVLKGIEPEDDLRIIQHISSACRASRLDPLEFAISGKILRLLNDQDIIYSRLERINSFWKLGLIATITLWIPVLLSNCYRIIQTTSLDLIFSIFWCCFILLNYVIVLVHPGLLAALYGLLLLIFIFIFYVAKTEWYRQSMERLSSSIITTNKKDYDDNRESNQLIIEHKMSLSNDQSSENFGNVSPMFEERSSSFFRKQRRRTDGIERKVTEKLATLQSNGGSGSSTPPLGIITNYQLPQLTNISTVVSKPNIEQMFNRSSHHNIVSGAELFSLCDRVLYSLNVSIVDGPLNETELNNVFNMIPEFCIPTENNDEYKMDFNRFNKWLESALEQTDINRQAGKVMKKRLESQRLNTESLEKLQSQYDDYHNQNQQQNQYQQQFQEDFINERDNNNNFNNNSNNNDNNNRDSVVSDLTMESVFLRNSYILGDTSNLQEDSSNNQVQGNFSPLKRLSLNEFQPETILESDEISK